MNKKKQLCSSGIAHLHTALSGEMKRRRYRTVFVCQWKERNPAFSGSNQAPQFRHDTLAFLLVNV